MKLMTLIVCAWALVGCTTTWTKPGLTAAEFRGDSYACERDMRQGGYYGNDRWAWLRAKGFYDRCMEAKGYEKAR